MIQQSTATPQGTVNHTGTQGRQRLSPDPAFTQRLL